MESAHGRGRRQPTSNAQHRRDPDLDPGSAKDVRSASSTGAHGGISNPKSGAAHLSPFSNDSGKNFKLGDVVSRLGQQDGAGAISKPKRTQDTETRKDRQKTEEDSSRSKQTANDSSSRSKTSRGDVSGTKAKVEDKSNTNKKHEDKRKEKHTSEESKTSSQTPKSKKRARSAARPRDTQVEPGKMASSATQDLSNADSKDQSRRASIPVILLSREDSKKHAEISEKPDSSSTQKRRMSALSQAKLALEKVAMAVTEAETVTTSRETAQQREKVQKGRKVRSQSTPRELVSPTAGEKSAKKKKTHTRHLPRDVDTPESEKNLLEEGKDYSKSMQHSAPVHHHRKTDASRNQNRLEGEISLEEVSTSNSQSQTSVTSTRRSSVPFKLFHSITKSSNIGTASSATTPQRQPTPSRPRKKFSRGHIDQDPLEVDYEILDDRVTSIEPRKPISAILESSRSLATDDSHKISAEQPLLPKHREPETKLNIYATDSTINKPAQRPSSMPYMQTFPRAKNQSTDLYSPGSDRNKSVRVTTSTSSEHVRHLSSNQLHSPESMFTSLHKIPSQSSFTSSDARSEVCLDLPDTTDNIEGDLQLHDTDLRVKVGFPSAPYRRIIHYTQFSIVLLVLSAIFVFIVSFILFWPLLVLVIFIVPLVVFIKRLCSWLCCCGSSLCNRCCLCLCHTHLTSSELLWLGRTKAGGSAVVQSLLVLQKGLDTDRIRNLIDSRLLSIENRHGRRLYRRFTQKVVAFCCGHAWVTDHHFVVSRHVYNMPGYIETLEDLQHFISKMAAEPLSLDYPLWEIQVLHNFREPRDTVLLFRMHACMTDGVSLMHVLENAFVDSQKVIACLEEFNKFYMPKSAGGSSSCSEQCHL